MLRELLRPSIPRHIVTGTRSIHSSTFIRGAASAEPSSSKDSHDHGSEQETHTRKKRSMSLNHHQTLGSQAFHQNSLNSWLASGYSVLDSQLSTSILQDPMRYERIMIMIVIVLINM